MLVHGTCVELDGAGVLLRGPPGSGKSDLALRLITERRGLLVADDQVEIGALDGALMARASASLAGMLEVRGLGLVRLDYRRTCEILVVIDLRERRDVDRMPELRRTVISGLSLPLFQLCAREASVVSKVVLALGVARGELSLDDGFGC